MTVTSEELKEWAASMRYLLDERPYEHPAAFALGMATMSGDTCIEVMFFPSAVNVGRENELTLAIIASILAAEDNQALPDGTSVRLRSSLIDRMLAQYPLNLVASATPFHHGNVWALRLMRDVSTSFPDSVLLRDRRRVPVLHVSRDLMAPPTSLEEVYLRLTAQSLRKTMPLETSAVRPDEAFGLLQNVVWTPRGVYTLDEYDEVVGMAMTMGIGNVPIILQDKLPRLLDYVRPRGVRIADGNRVRLGAYLAEGTTVMHEGFANFNAVTLGECMVEGRISAGVTVGAHSDIGGGVSTLGTMSGGNNVRVSVGEYCLLEAECVLGIPIGDRVRVEAGLALKSTTPVRVVDPDRVWVKRQSSASIQEVLGQNGYTGGQVVKAGELAGINDAIFRRNSLTGAVEVLHRGDHKWGKLNEVLHKN